MKVLVLAGTAEARELSFALERAGIDLITSLAGATERPAPMAGASRVGGFGGAPGLAEFIKANDVSHLVDATHPFAAQMSRNAHEAAETAQIPLVQLVRPAWPEKPNWHMHDDLAAAASALPTGATVFLSTGRGSLAAFADRDDVTFIARVIDDLPGPFPLPKGRFQIGKPPFSVQEEVATLNDAKIDVLVSRNSGGTGGIEKILAAEHLGLKIFMVKRPSMPQGNRVETVDDALAWLTKT